ncbi:MAG: hypothetical protein JWM74_4087, partial [Myxococcaceae bacterium]|nr:hypothetical protein [Myxococcaceae bacterium]
GKKLEAFEKEREETERVKLLASREVTPELAKVLKSKPLHLVRDIVATLPMKTARNLAADVNVTTTRGEGQGADSTERRTAHLPPTERRELDEQMGVSRQTASIRRERNGVVYGAMTAEEARKHVADKAKEGSK